MCTRSCTSRCGSQKVVPGAQTRGASGEDSPLRFSENREEALGC